MPSTVPSNNIRDNLSSAVNAAVYCCRTQFVDDYRWQYKSNEHKISLCKAVIESALGNIFLLSIPSNEKIVEKTCADCVGNIITIDHCNIIGCMTCPHDARATCKCCKLFRSAFLQATELLAKGNSGGGSGATPYIKPQD